jgi:hypothetical protein
VLCVLYRSQNKQQLLPYTSLNDCFFITEVERGYCAVCTESLCKTVKYSEKESGRKGPCHAHVTDETNMCSAAYKRKVMN